MAKGSTPSTSRPRSRTKGPSTKRKMAPKSAASLTPASQPAPAPDPVIILRKKSFVERVMVEGGVRKGEARQMTEAVLKVLGEALSEGEELNIPPLGKLKINRQFEKNGDEILVVKLRRKGADTTDAGASEKSDQNPLADPGEGR
ncbi:MAG: hypothetical protein EP320_10110 [Rhodobacteraceae bacterium]|nr:MAG: hypothetical protein EP320_10110 [Paracoccaceae bacterium]